MSLEQTNTQQFQWSLQHMPQHYKFSFSTVASQATLQHTLFM